jgi:hypothetical protein
MITIHYNKRKTKFTYYYSELPSPTKITKTQIASGVLHYKEVLNSDGFAKLSDAQQESVLCLKKKWETMQYAY